MSNLTNLLVVSRLSLPFWRFAIAMALPNANDAASPAFFRAAASALCALLIGLFAAGSSERPLWPAAVLGAAGLLLVGRANGVPATALVLRSVSWPLFVFVWAMAAIVRGMEHAGLIRSFAHVVLGHAPASLGGLAVAAVGANLFNNIPMTLVLLPAIAAAGSLATIIWLSLVRRQGVAVPALEYLRVAAVTVPLALAAAFAVLALEGGLR